MNTYMSGWKKAFDYNGVASRSEFWVFYLLNVLIFLVMAVIEGMIRGGNEDTSLPISILFYFISLIPVIALSTRRLHDIGWSGWIQLIVFIPLGELVLLIAFLLPSKKTENKYIVEQNTQDENSDDKDESNNNIDNKPL